MRRNTRSSFEDRGAFLLGASGSTNCSDSASCSRRACLLFLSCTPPSCCWLNCNRRSISSTSSSRQSPSSIVILAASIGSSSRGFDADFSVLSLGAEACSTSRSGRGLRIEENGSLPRASTWRYACGSSLLRAREDGSLIKVGQKWCFSCAPADFLAKQA
uniref:Uncharacterized protein n=1 Tax=Arundo donax TaxID=35708 RepID=A0A0A9CTH4_ARUDO